jgi:hypothetical protein
MANGIAYNELIRMAGEHGFGYIHVKGRFIEDRGTLGSILPYCCTGFWSILAEKLPTLSLSSSPGL